MTLKDRFMDYCNNDGVFSDYEYDLSIFEQMTYGVILTVALVVGVLALVVLFPIWVVPYFIYRAIKIRKEDNNGDKHSSGIEDED